MRWCFTHDPVSASAIDWSSRVQSILPETFRSLHREATGSLSSCHVQSSRFLTGESSAKPFSVRLLRQVQGAAAQPDEREADFTMLEVPGLEHPGIPAGS